MMLNLKEPIKLQCLNIILPIPDSKLSPNRKHGKHWVSTFDVKSKAKDIGYYSMLEAWANATNFTANKNDILRQDIIVYSKGKRRLDDDNLLGAFKPYRDGIFIFLNERLGLDDRQIQFTTLNTMHMDKDNPRLEWRLSIYE